MTQAEKAHDFEKTLEELEGVVSQLDGEVKLEKALELFEHGVLLSKRCEEFLKGAEQKVEILKRLADGSIVAQKFDDGKTETISSVISNYDVEDEDDEDDEEDDDDDDDDDEEDEEDDDEDEEDSDDDTKYSSKSKVKAGATAKQAARSKKKESLEIGMQTESADSTNQLRIKIEEA